MVGNRIILVFCVIDCTYLLVSMGMTAAGDEALLSCRRDLQSCREGYRSALAQISALTVEKDRLRHELTEEREKRLPPLYDNETTALRAELAEAISQRNQATANCEALLTKVAEVQALKEEVAVKNAAMDVLRQELEETRVEVTELREDLERVTCEALTSDNECQFLRAQLRGQPMSAAASPLQSTPDRGAVVSFGDSVEAYRFGLTADSDRGEGSGFSTPVVSRHQSFTDTAEAKSALADCKALLSSYTDVKGRIRLLQAVGRLALTEQEAEELRHLQQQRKEMQLTLSHRSGYVAGMMASSAFASSCAASPLYREPPSGDAASDDAMDSIHNSLLLLLSEIQQELAGPDEACADHPHHDMSPRIESLHTQLDGKQNDLLTAEKEVEDLHCRLKYLQSADTEKALPSQPSKEGHGNVGPSFARLEPLQNTVCTLQAAVDQHKMETATLLQALCDERAEKAALDAEVGTLRAALTEMQQQLEARDHHLQTLQIETVSLRQQLDSLQEKPSREVVCESAAVVDSYRADIRLQDEPESITDISLNSSGAEQEALTIELQAEFERLGGLLADACRERDSAASRAEDLQALLDAAVASASGVEEILRAELVRAVQEKKELYASHTNAMEALSALQERCRSVEADDAQAEIAAMDEKGKADRSKSIREMKELVVNLREKENVITTQQSSDLAARVASLDAERDTLVEGQSQVAEQVIEERDGVVASHKDHVDSLDEQVSTLRMQLMQIKDKMATREMEFAESASLAASFQAQLDAATKMPRAFDILLRVEAEDQTWCQIRCDHLLLRPSSPIRDIFSVGSYLSPCSDFNQMCIVWKSDAEVLEMMDSKEVDNSGGFSIGD